jgi:glycoside/pentoside/hexuronide:cation symporter, GPH family
MKELVNLSAEAQPAGLSGVAGAAVGDMVALQATMLERPRLDLATKVLYGVGEIANASKTVLFGLFLLFFYTGVMGLPGTLVGIAAAIGLVWDAVIDPYIGHLSDRVRLRLGRRHAFMFAGAVAVGPTFWALFSPPPGLSTSLLFAWLVITSLLVRLAHSVFVVPYHALGAELSRDYHERTSITGIRGACALVGTVVTAGLSFVLFFPNVVPGQDPKLNYAGYPAMGLAWGLVMSVAALVATVATLHWRPFLRRSAENENGHSEEDSTNRGPVQGFGRDFAVALRNPSFRALFLSFSLLFLGIVVNGTLAIHFLTYSVAITDSGALSGVQFAFYGGALAGVAVWLRLARRAEKRWLYAIATLATAGLMLAASVLFGDGRLLGQGDARPLLAGQALAGFFGSLFWILPHSMLADVADMDELATQKRREGIYFGILSFGQQLATGLSVLITGALLDWYAGFIPGQAQQLPHTVERIGILFGVLPAALLLGALLLIRGYRLDRRRVEAIQDELLARRGRAGDMLSAVNGEASPSAAIAGGRRDG